MNLSPSNEVGMSVALFFGILLCLEIGFRIGLASSKRNHELAYEGTGTIDAAVFALLGLLLGFSFAGAMSRFDARRQLIVNEANTIGTAYLRIDLLPASDQPQIRALFREYLGARLRAFEVLRNRDEARQEFARAGEIQQIWSRALTASKNDSTQNSARLLMPAINDMMDVTTARMIAAGSRLPALIFLLLVSVALLSGLLAGYAMAKRKSRSWLHMILYATVIPITIYAVLDFEDPRSGLIRVDAADKALIQLRDSIRQ
jgi:ABC-type glycerol-3-phosphate transport system permease component